MTVFLLVFLTLTVDVRNLNWGSGLDTVGLCLCMLSEGSAGSIPRMFWVACRTWWTYLRWEAVRESMDFKIGL